MIGDYMRQDKLCIGFTGSQEGPSHRQMGYLRVLLQGFQKVFRELEFHHGDCIGADDEAAGVASALGIPLIMHPPDDDSRRAFTNKRLVHAQIWYPKGYLARNHDIVNQTELLIACPKEFLEVVRSGTWATIRYARKKGKKILLLDWFGGVMK